MPPVDWKQLESCVAGVFDQVVAWRRHVHQHPELSNVEFDTTAYIESELRKMDPEGRHLIISKPVPTGLVVDMKGGKAAGPSKDNIIFLRAHIDALPVTEAADVEFKSKTPGMMHACGHDSHVAMLLGAVKLLLEDVDNIDGTVRFLFQPAKEMPPGGAVQMIEAGCLEGVTMAFAQHIAASVGGLSGSVVVRDGVFMCSSDRFNVKIIGKGGRALMPEAAIDPIPIAAHAVVALQSLVTRCLPSSAAPIMTITGIAPCTDTHNVIPDL